MRVRKCTAVEARVVHIISDMARCPTVQVLAAAVICLVFADGAHASPSRQRTGLARPRATSGTRPAPRRTAAATRTPTLPCGDYLGFQVLLDRQGFSPGQIDGRPGSNFAHAIAALQGARKLTASGQPDCDTWRALNGASAEPAVTTYTVTEDDVKGPFEKQIPKSLVEQAKLPSLAYASPIEKLGERFHASPALLQRLNPGPITPGRQIRVPAVMPFDPDARPAAGAAPNDVTIQVTKEDSSLRATRADGTVVLFAPVTTGSEHDPLPTGDYKVVGVGWHPPFHYNPDLFWDAKASDEKATIKPGPNNPVGIAWISLSLEHYGLHGTPEPGNIGHTESHGCVRMTNWDASRVAALVKPGTPVLFR
jgi:lipoprotein-anchoring transpeptidase ErfK/SrfK